MHFFLIAIKNQFLIQEGFLGIQKSKKKTINIKVAHFNCFKGDKTDIGKGHYEKIKLLSSKLYSKFLPR